MKISEYLKEGKENATSMETLIQRTGYSRRDIQKMIAAERRDGILIVSDTQRPGGFYLPGNAEELAEFVRHMDSRAKAAMVACRGARQRLRELEAADAGQVTFPETEAPEQA